MNKLLLLLALCLGLLTVWADEEAADTTADDEEEANPATFSEEELQAIEDSATKFEFQAEVTRLMEIIIHSLYTQREIFTRELISNAGDALDKIRYKSLLDKEILGDTTDLQILIRADNEANTLTLTDTGIGMTKKELEENLGTVARSGTAAFLDAFAQQKEGEDGNAMNLIGQFGVGFYSAFLVADEVTVVSKSPDDENQHVWRSQADGSFTVAVDPRGNTLGRGTSVTLTLKEDAAEYLDNAELERVVMRYSQFMQYPIKLWTSKKETVEIPIEEEDDDEESAEGDDEDEDDELVAEDEDDDEDEEDKPTTRTEEKTVWYWKQLNDQKPIWTRRPSQIEDSEYDTFYKSFAKGSDSYLAKTHFRAEGEIEFDSLLFVPDKAPWGLYDNYYTQKSSLALYVRRVLVADKFEDFIPRYLNFIKGLVDSNDLPLNVNREQLQRNKIMKVISKKVTRKALDMLRKMAEAEAADDEDDEDDESAEDSKEDDDEATADEEDDDDDEEESVSTYSKFYGEFGRSIKLGVIEDTKNRKKLVNLLRFTSLKHPEVPVSLATYVDEMAENQKNIYFITAATQEEAASSPFLERARSKNFDVLYFVENLDEYMNLADYDDYTLQSVTKEGLDLGDGSGGENYKKEKKEEFETLTNWLKDLYGSKVSKVEVSLRLETSPLIIATTKYGHSANMERITRGQAFGKSSGRATKVVEINPRHPIIKKLRARVEEDKESEETKDYANVLYDMALIQSGFSIEASDVSDYSSRLERVVRDGLQVSADEEVEAMPEFADDEEDDMDEDDEDDDDEEEELLDDDDEVETDDDEDAGDDAEDADEEASGHDEL